MKDQINDNTSSERIESIEETRTRLQEAIQNADGQEKGQTTSQRTSEIAENAETTSNEKPSTDSDPELSVTKKLKHVVSDTRERLTPLSSDKDQSSGSEGAIETLDDLLTVADEAEDVLESIEFSEIPEAIKLSALPEAIDMDDLPKAIAEGDTKRAIRFRKLLQLIDLDEARDLGEFTEIHQEADEFSDATAEVTGEDNNTEREESAEQSDVGGEIAAAMDQGGDSSAIASEAIQAKTQSEIDDAADELRKSILETHERVEKLTRELEEQTGSVEQPSSRNPSAYSSLAAGRGDMKSTTSFSTVPQKVRHSSASGRQRIYGSRFQKAIENSNS